MNGTGRLPGGFHRSGARLGSKRTRTSPADCSPGLLPRRTCGSLCRVFQLPRYSRFPRRLFRLRPARLLALSRHRLSRGACSPLPFRRTLHFLRRFLRCTRADRRPIRARLLPRHSLPARSGFHRRSGSRTRRPVASHVALVTASLGACHRSNPRIGFAQRGAERMPSFAHCAESSIALIPHD